VKAVGDADANAAADGAFAEVTDVAASARRTSRCVCVSLAAPGAAEAHAAERPNVVRAIEESADGPDDAGERPSPCRGDRTAR
jgi:hypothetical protein